MSEVLYRKADHVKLNHEMWNELEGMLEKVELSDITLQLVISMLIKYNLDESNTIGELLTALRRT